MYQVVTDVMASFTVLMGVMRIMDVLAVIVLLKSKFRRVKGSLANTYGSSPCSQVTA